MVHLDLLSIFVLAFTLVHSQVFPTPLQKYVWATDPTYNYTLVNQLRGVDTTTYNIHMYSQTWLTKEDSSISVWDHWLTVVVPDNIDMQSTQSGIYVDGDGQSPNPPDGQDLLANMLAVQTGLVVAHLHQIPNEPAYFTAEGCCRRRTEDAVIAYTWSHYINDTSHPEWLLRCPMVKAVVRAMDTLQDFVPKIRIPKPEKFAIAGASKRGWTTWLLPAVDQRVNAIIPMVMPILNMVQSINQMWRSLGLWTFAFKDYLDMNLMAHLNTGGLQAIADVVDPVVYMSYLKPIPKYMIFSTGDEFFLPDSARNFLDELQGDFYLRMAPNTDHSLSPLDAVIINNIATFIQYVRHGATVPKIQEKIEYSNTSATITVIPSIPPTQARVYQATTLSTTRRDFRLLICGQIPQCLQPVLWTYTELKPNSDGSFSATVSKPMFGGWTGFLIELSYLSTYPPAGQQWFQVTSRVVIVPDTYPYPSCGLNCGKNSTLFKEMDFSESTPEESEKNHHCSLLLPTHRPCLPPLQEHLSNPLQQN